MNLLFICPVHASPLAPKIVFTLMSEALKRDKPGTKLSDYMEIIGALSMDADHGWAAVLALTSYHEVDSVICFGKSSASIGLPDLEPLLLQYVRLHRRLPLSTLVRLPSPLSPFWNSEVNVENATLAIKPLLHPPPAGVHRPHIAWDGTTWN